MRDYLLSYKKYIKEILNSDDVENPQEIIDNHLIQIGFFQHERLVHLIVTFIFAVLLVIFIVATMLTNNIFTLILSVILIVLECFYIKHYYFLENETQKFYDDYNALITKFCGKGFDRNNTTGVDNENKEDK